MECVIAMPQVACPAKHTQWPLMRFGSQFLQERVALKELTGMKEGEIITLNKIIQTVLKLVKFDVTVMIKS